MRIPIFSLGVVLYPKHRMPLYIFEDRYKDLMAVCLEGDSAFGIVCLHEGNMARIGCTARITRVLQRYGDGRMDVLVGGERRFRLTTVYSDKAYMTAEIKYLEDVERPLRKGSLERIVSQHMRLLEIAGRPLRPEIYEAPTGVSYAIARSAGLTLEQKQSLLELTTENRRINFLIAHLEAFLPKIERTAKLRRRIQSNGHAKDCEDA